MIEFHSHQKSAESDDNVKDHCKAENFDQRIDKASLMVIITELPLEFENDVTLENDVGFFRVLDFDDVFVVLDSLRCVILLEDYFVLTVGLNIILRELVYHNDQLVLMPRAEPNKVLSISTRFSLVLFNLVSFIVVLIALEAQLLNEQIFGKGLRSLIILNMTSNLRILRKFDQRVLNIHSQFVNCSGFVPIEFFQGGLNSFIVSTISLDNGLFVKFSIFGVNVAIDEGAGE